MKHDQISHSLTHLTPSPRSAPSLSPFCLPWVTIDAWVQLARNFAPVREHPVHHSFPITGTMSACINGVYLRNPDPLFHPSPATTRSHAPSSTSSRPTRTGSTAIMARHIRKRSLRLQVTSAKTRRRRRRHRRWCSTVVVVLVVKVEEVTMDQPLILVRCAAAEASCVATARRWQGGWVMQWRWRDWGLWVVSVSMGMRRKKEGRSSSSRWWHCCIDE